MKLLFRKNIIKSLAGILTACVATVAFTSCDALYDDLDPCPEGVRLRFVYDYNMEFFNTFPAQVDCLTLFVYDKEGNYVTTRTASAPEISDENYRMTIDLPAGDYQFLAYGGMDCEKSSFHFVKDPTKIKMSEVEVELNSDMLTRPVGKPLHPLFYGKGAFTIEADTPKYSECTAYMMKDTNNLRILLAHVNYDPIDETLFTYTLTDNNTLFNFDNNIISTADVTYYPWSRGIAAMKKDDDALSRATTPVAAYAEFSTSRFIADSDPILTIKANKEGQEKLVLRIHLLDFLYMMKSDNEKYRDLTPQQFLDRESEWSMMFFLDADNNWMRTIIEINGWVVRINNIGA